MRFPTGQEIIQGLNQSLGSADGKKWMHSGCILKVDLIGLHNWL